MTDKAKERAAKAAQLKAEREKAESRQRNLITVAVIAVVAVLIGVAYFAIQSASDANSVPYTEPANSTQDYGFLIAPEDLGFTSDNPADVVIYEDMQCPACAAFHVANRDFFNQQLEAGTITLEYRVVSFLDRASSNNYSSRAANAAACVWNHDGAKVFKDFQDVLYSTQPSEGGPGPENEQLGETALGLGASAAVVPCINDGVFGPWVEKTYEVFNDGKISGTPSIFIGGEAVSSADGGLPSIADMEKAIAAVRQ